MSAIGGVVHFTHKLDDGIGNLTSTLDKLDRALAWLGPDGSHRRALPPGAALFRPFYTKKPPEAITQPLQHAGSLVTVDGRLDNLGTLRSELMLASSSTEPEVVMAAYEAWGAECFSRFFGDFAIAIWDSRQRKVILARDPFGTRPLYYEYGRHRQCCWASMPDAILSATGASQEVDPRYIATYLSSQADVLHSPFRYVQPVPPGCVVTAKEDGLAVNQFWTIWKCAQDERVLTEDRYEEEFRSLFFNAVRVRMVSDYPIVSELSGGLDSSSIACAAANLGFSCNTPGAPLGTLSIVFDRASQSDERLFIRAVERRLGAAGIHLREDDARCLGAGPTQVSFLFPTRALALAAE